MSGKLTNATNNFFFFLSESPLLNISQHTTMDTPFGGCAGCDSSCLQLLVCLCNEAELPALSPAFRS